MVIMSHHDASIPDVLNVNAKVIRQQSVPSLGFGTWQLKEQTCQQSVESALETGYRHIDTARMYENEVYVGKGIANGGVPRSELFVTSKVWMEDLSPETVKRGISESLGDLKLDYLDLILIHWPNPDYSIEKALGAMLEYREKGLVRQIGVSNFTSKQLLEALAYAPVFCNQVEYHPFLGQDKLLGVCRAHDVLMTAYCPLAQGKAGDDPDIQRIAKKHGKTPQQITIRWLIEQNHVAAIPRSSNPKHIQSNFDVFDFELDAEDRSAIRALPKDDRLCEPDWAPDWDEQ